MKKLLSAVRHLAWWQRLVVVAMLVLVLLTWLAVGLVLTGNLAP
jgi:hypothetical protein